MTEVQFWKTPYKWKAEVAINNKVVEKLNLRSFGDCEAEVIKKELKRLYPDARLVEMQ